MAHTMPEPTRPLYALTTGEKILLHVNQGDRHATCLAGLGSESLIEYLMPEGTSALRIYKLGEGYRNISYDTVPRRFVKEMLANEIEWVGKIQGGRQAKTVTEVANRTNARKGKK